MISMVYEFGCTLMPRYMPVISVCCCALPLANIRIMCIMKTVESLVFIANTTV